MVIRLLISVLLFSITVLGGICDTRLEWVLQELLIHNFRFSRIIFICLRGWKEVIVIVVVITIILIIVLIIIGGICNTRLEWIVRVFFIHTSRLSQNLHL
ncbi:hypothetical protein DFH28DRAFT_209196 [Melampsora americana]|nr:hypothetical protein DFH28DRAFT_209196 [Melampsora americana]